MDVNYTEADKVIKVKVPEEYYDLCALLRDPNHYVVESVVHNSSGLQDALYPRADYII